MPHIQKTNRFLSSQIDVEDFSPLARWIILDTPADVVAAIRLGKASDIIFRGGVNCIYFPFENPAQDFITKLNTESARVRREKEIYECLLPKETFKDFSPRKNGLR